MALMMGPPIGRIGGGVEVVTATSHSSIRSTAEREVASYSFVPDGQKVLVSGVIYFNSASSPPSIRVGGVEIPQNGLFARSGGDISFAVETIGPGSVTVQGAGTISSHEYTIGPGKIYVANLD